MSTTVETRRGNFSILRARCCSTWPRKQAITPEGFLECLRSRRAGRHAIRRRGVSFGKSVAGHRHHRVADSALILLGPWREKRRRYALSIVVTMLSRSPQIMTPWHSYARRRRMSRNNSRVIVGVNGGILSRGDVLPCHLAMTALRKRPCVRALVEISFSARRIRLSAAHR